VTRLAFALTFTFTLSGCHAPKPIAPLVAPTAHFDWKTLRAEHRVALDVTLADGKHDRRALRGVIAIERPVRFRLRAFGPAGITLFDLLSVAGRVKVLEAIKDPQSSALGPVIQSLAGDLSAAFLLEPTPPDRKVTVERDTVVVSEPARTVRLSAFTQANGHAVPTRIAIDNPSGHYAVVVDARENEADSTLDPALFKE
jgi:hypothetical protein